MHYPKPSVINAATQVITAGGITFTEISSSLVVIGGGIFTIGPSATPTTDVFNSQTISIGPNGVGFGSTTVSYVPPSTATTQVVTAGGITFTEIGPSIVVIGGSTFTIGPSATPTTDVFASQTISIGLNGVGFAGTTIQYSPGATVLATATTVTPRVSLTKNGGPSGKSFQNWDILVVCELLGFWFWFQGYCN